jgi:hypothetical protein
MAKVSPAKVRVKRQILVSFLNLNRVLGNQNGFTSHHFKKSLKYIQNKLSIWFYFHFYLKKLDLQNFFK